MSSPRRSIFQRSSLLYDLHEFCVNADTREIFLHSDLGSHEDEPGVDYRMSTRFIKNLTLLEYLNKDPILIHLQTDGGEWNDGMAIFDAIQHSVCHIIILVHGHAMSMGSIILQAADLRVMMPHAEFMIHNGDYEINATTKTVITHAEMLKINTNTMLDIYCNQCVKGKFFVEKNKKERAIRTFLIDQMNKKEDWFLNAEETVEYGFADYVLGNSKYSDIKSLKEI